MIAKKQAALLQLPADHTPVQQALHLSECCVKGYVQFQYGSCSGAIRVGTSAYELLTVFNDEPGNGDFACLLRHLIKLGYAHGRDVLLLENHNESLYGHLMRCWEMKPVADTKHQLLVVAGPGTCPAAYLAAKASARIDQLDCLLAVLQGEVAIW